MFSAVFGSSTPSGTIWWTLKSVKAHLALEALGEGVAQAEEIDGLRGDQRQLPTIHTALYKGTLVQLCASTTTA